VLGTGIVGRTIAVALADLQHEVVIGTRDVAATLGRSSPPMGDWLAEQPRLRLVAYEHTAGCDLFVNATNGAGSLAALGAVGPGLSGRIVLDIANPLDFGRGFPPTLLVKDDDSLGEQLQRAFPAAKVVKTLNTVTAAVMVAPHLLPGPSTIFLSGDDADAKAVVRGILGSFGWIDILDLGGIDTARGTEMYLPLWIRTMQALGTPVFNVAVLR